ncbi:MAG: hypothetical protein Q3M30_17410 [Candidatus Electrothrix sp. Rat3]|nr:hypothetical protein [Candidatus Electrothrix rattekaaiensis]
MKQRNTTTWFIGILLLLLFPAFASAQEAGVPPDGLNNVGEVLITILVLSIVFEVALTPIFNWRLFLQHAEGKGWKTPIIIGVALIVFWSYDLDIIRNLLVALGQKAELSFGGQVLTALLIAGGSDGVFRIFTKLNIRNPTERKEKAEQARAEARKKETGQDLTTGPQDGISS